MAQNVDKQDEDSLFSYLQGNVFKIISEINALKASEVEIKRNPNKEVPKLNNLDSASIGMDYNSIIKKLGKPKFEEEFPNLIVLTYLYNNKSLRLGIDPKSRKIVNLMTNSPNIKIPLDLSVGIHLSRFENIYGSRAYRKVKRIGIDHDLLIYPFSNLSLVINIKTRNVVIIMISLN